LTTDLVFEYDGVRSACAVREVGDLYGCFRAGGVGITESDRANPDPLEKPRQGPRGGEEWLRGVRGGREEITIRRRRGGNGERGFSDSKDLVPGIDGFQGGWPGRRGFPQGDLIVAGIEDKTHSLALENRHGAGVSAGLQEGSGGLTETLTVEGTEEDRRRDGNQEADKGGDKEYFRQGEAGSASS